MNVKLKENQLALIQHLAQFEVLDYFSCLRFLDTDKTNDRTALSYAFRPLTKNNYLRKHKDGHVTILAKGRALFPQVKSLVTLGGGNTGKKRVNSISRTGMFMAKAGIISVASPNESKRACFVPSTCWRTIHKGILSTARFTGVLLFGSHRLAVYDIGDGSMEWQLRAERSLFKSDYFGSNMHATGMLLICNNDKRVEIAQRIIRQTMWSRKQLIDKRHVKDRDKPVSYSRSPIKLTSQYEHVYLTTPALLRQSILEIQREEGYIAQRQGNCPACYEKKQGDYEKWPFRHFINTTTDLLKYVYFFVQAKQLMTPTEGHVPELKCALTLPKRDFPIVCMYPDVDRSEVTVFYEYKP